MTAIAVTTFLFSESRDTGKPDSLITTYTSTHRERESERERERKRETEGGREAGKE